MGLGGGVLCCAVLYPRDLWVEMDVFEHVSTVQVHVQYTHMYSMNVHCPPDTCTSCLVNEGYSRAHGCKKEFPLARRCPSLPGSNLPAGRDSPPSSSWNHQSGRTTAGGEVHHTSRKYWMRSGCVKEGLGSWCGLGSGLEADDREMMATLFFVLSFRLASDDNFKLHGRRERDPLVTI